MVVRKRRVPEVVVKRLALYLRTLQQPGINEQGKYISSKELGKRAGVTPAQVRKDLALFGEFGKQGVGYEVKYLSEELRRILNAHRKINLALIGVGELGLAVSRYLIRKSAVERNYPFNLVALFDNDPTKIGQAVEGIPVLPPAELEAQVKEQKIRMAILAVPAEVAQEAADACIASGIKALLNFAPTKLHVPAQIRLQYSDVSLDLQQLGYHL